MKPAHTEKARERRGGGEREGNSKKKGGGVDALQKNMRESV